MKAMEETWKGRKLRSELQQYGGTRRYGGSSLSEWPTEGWLLSKCGPLLSCLPPPTPHSRTGKQNVWSGPSHPTPGPAPAPLPWRWEAVEGTADFGGVGMGWWGGMVGAGKTKCLRKRVPRTVGEQASNHGLRNPPPRGDGALKHPIPGTRPCGSTRWAQEETRASPSVC